jgi:hypothetical protein
MNTPLYVASRASIPARSEMWRYLRDVQGWNIISTWIDEAGPGETADMCELWRRITKEVAKAKVLIAYIDRDDLPGKGVLVEIGMALAEDKLVILLLAGMTFAEAPKLVGSWFNHPNVRTFSITNMQPYSWEFLFKAYGIQ